MTAHLFQLPEALTIPVKGETAEYPVGRIFCVGRNYAAHAEEMGYEVDREAPFYFTKSPTAAVLSGSTAAYPLGTENYHYEMELALVIGSDVTRATSEEAEVAIYGYCCALDMTRRDLQLKERVKQRPWDLGKDVEQSAVFSTITKATDFTPADQRIHLSVNGDLKQDSTLSLLVHKVADIVADLSKYYHLRAGDVILTGTPEGVGPVVPGDVISGGIDGLDPISLTIGASI
jgi:fumarylpyruvate hydrolase